MRASSPVGGLLGEVNSGPRPDAQQDSSVGDMDIHECPEHWKDKKREPTGTSPCHLEVDEAIIASRKLLPDDVI